MVLLRDSLTSLWLLLCQPRSPKTCVPCIMPSNVSECLWNENQGYWYAHTSLQWCLDFNFEEYYKLNIENLCILFLNLIRFWHNSKQYSPKQAWDLVNIRNLPKPPGGPRNGLFFIFYKLFLFKKSNENNTLLFLSPSMNEQLLIVMLAPEPCPWSIKYCRLPVLFLPQLPRGSQ